MSGECIPVVPGRAPNFGPGRSAGRTGGPPPSADDDTAAVPRHLLQAARRPSSFNELHHATGWIVVWSFVPKVVGTLHHEKATCDGRGDQPFATRCFDRMVFFGWPRCETCFRHGPLREVRKTTIADGPGEM